MLGGCVFSRVALCVHCLEQIPLATQYSRNQKTFKEKKKLLKNGPLGGRSSAAPTAAEPGPGRVSQEPSQGLAAPLRGQRSDISGIRKPQGKRRSLRKPLAVAPCQAWGSWGGRPGKGRRRRGEPALPGGAEDTPRPRKWERPCPGPLEPWRCPLLPGTGGGYQATPGGRPSRSRLQE